jgi:hypothetical protein
MNAFSSVDPGTVRSYREAVRLIVTDLTIADLERKARSRLRGSMN